MYYCARAFLPLLIASGDGVLVNTSSVNGFWATLGPGMPNTAYCTAKFAVKGFSEALIEDLRTHAPQVRVAVVMPSVVNTGLDPARSSRLAVARRICDASYVSRLVRARLGRAWRVRAPESGARYRPDPSDHPTSDTLSDRDRSADSARGT